MEKEKARAPTLSIIIVSFNTKDLLDKCLESLISNIQYRISNYEIIVVDNGSTDGSRELVRQISQIKPIRLIYNSANLGFAKAVNQGIKKSTGDYILLLNSDIIVRSGAIEKLIDFAKKNPDAGVVGGGLVDPDGAPQPSVYHFPTTWGAFKECWLGQKGAFEKYLPATAGPAVVEAVVGAVMLIPRTTITKIGLFNERYFMYFEDLDYCRRVKRAELKVYYLPQAKFVHHHGASGKAIGAMTRSWLVASSKKYHGPINYYLLTGIIWLGLKIRSFLGK